MRDFLLDKKIVGAMMVSRCGGILHYTIPRMMELVDYLIIMFDFPDDNTKKIVLDYKEKYGNIEAFDSLVPSNIGTMNKHYFQNMEQGMFKRFNALQGQIREKMLEHIKDKMRGGEHIDIVIWPDSDEYLISPIKDILIDFTNKSDKKGVILKSIDVFNDFHHITIATMGTHLRIFKPEMNQHIMPYMGLAKIHTITKPFIIRHLNSYLHLYMLTKEKREWRAKHWRARDKETYLKLPLWKTEKDARELTMQEVEDIFKKPADTTIGEYLINNKLEV